MQIITNIIQWITLMKTYNIAKFGALKDKKVLAHSVNGGVSEKKQKKKKKKKAKQSICTYNAIYYRWRDQI